MPREAFVPEALQEFAYEDTPLPIEEGQTISQPYIVALMVEAADVESGDRVLEIGAGSGYAAAVLGELAGRVFTRSSAIPPLAELARAPFAQLGYDNVEVRDGRRHAGLARAGAVRRHHRLGRRPARARRPGATSSPSAAGWSMPVGDDADAQRLIRLTRTGHETWHEEELGEVRFVPLIGEQGWARTSTRPSADKPRREPRPTQRPAPS